MHDIALEDGKAIHFAVLHGRQNCLRHACDTCNFAHKWAVIQQVKLGMQLK